MYTVCRGVRVLEVATWTFVPAAGAVLADWGADVIKIEHPLTGDPQRGLSNQLVPGAGPNPMMEVPNRGKRSVGIELAHPEGVALVHRLAAEADVFLTNLLPQARQRLHIDVDDLHAINPLLIYARGSAQGDRGPEADRGGFDLASTWARSSIAHQMTPEGGEPPLQPGSIGDLVGGLTIAGGVAAALFQREREGCGTVIDVSLYGVGMWMMSQSITRCPTTLDLRALPRAQRWNPIANPFPTADGRWIMLSMLYDAWWPDLCVHLGRPDLATDLRFADPDARIANRAECVSELDAIFKERTLEEWRTALATTDGVWAPVLAPDEVAEDPQALANGYLPEVTAADATTYRGVASPIQFDGLALERLQGAPEHGHHTEEVLLELGLSWDELASLKESGAIL